MGYKPVVDICDAWLIYVKFAHPWHGNEIVIANANPHAMMILFLFVLPMVLQGMDLRTNPFQEGENDANQIASRLSIHELQCFDGVFTRMEAVGLEMVPRKGFQAFLGNKCSLKELPTEQHHVWMIVWSMGSLMMQGGANEYVAPFGELTSTLGIHQTTLARVLTLPTGPRSYRGKADHLATWRSLVHHRVDWVVVPRPPKVPVAPIKGQGAGFLVKAIGRITKSLGEPDSAHPLAHFWSLLGPSM
ncbi:hypothetical protein R3W88_014721 [Solanum pinnatisectum]|uniref:Uncharacterized protein n=1 Tax=Solanum pinnatisectum TaxID=50273 RepID=A0AAV9KTW3_9SOLN|nr:hypothetical protein R3W88_014721 [Solanum pinnatisectum]